MPLLVYAPTSIQRRFLDGYQAPLTVLAALGLWGTFSGVRRPLLRKMYLGLLVGLMTLTNLLLVAGGLAMLPGRGIPIYRPAEERAAADWLAQRAQGDVVLSSYQSGNYLPTRGLVRVFLGHRPETMRSAEKYALVERFFDVTIDDAWRRNLLAEYSVGYIFWGPAERALGDFDPALSDYLIPIYDVDGYVVFEVLGDDGV